MTQNIKDRKGGNSELEPIHPVFDQAIKKQNSPSSDELIRHVHLSSSERAKQFFGTLEIDIKQFASVFVRLPVDGHEPDNSPSEIRNVVLKGKRFDNAGGSWEGDFGEKHLIFKDLDNNVVGEINIATLTAFAMLGFKRVLELQQERKVVAN